MQSHFDSNNVPEDTKASQVLIFLPCHGAKNVPEDNKVLQVLVFLPWHGPKGTLAGKVRDMAATAPSLPGLALSGIGSHGGQLLMPGQVPVSFRCAAG